MKLAFHRSNTNYHGTQQKGERWNEQTVRGPKLRYVKIDTRLPYYGHRFIFYFRDGSCWYFDIMRRI